MNDDVIELSEAEIIELAAMDSEFYCRQFFPRTIRQPFADFHHDAWKKLESENRLVNLLMFRGSGKTSHARLYTSKIVAYSLAHTILYVSKSEPHAIRSASWLKRNVESNTRWTDVYKIKKGSKWQDLEFEIIVGADEIPIWVTAAGIMGSIRGLNRDDYRPDGIILDDVLDDENAHTLEQRKKITNLVYGALLESLAPRSEAPHAKMVSLNTPQNKEDFAVTALKDPSWTSAVYGCFTKETANMPLEYQESAWPERFPTEELREEKKAAMRRNMLSTFLREKEVKLVSSETASFKVNWLKKYGIAPEGIVCIYVIDPVPPPSDVELQKGLARKDYEAHVVWGALGDKRFLLDYRVMRGHEPTWSVTQFFELQQKWRPIRCLVEAVAYQRTLAWLIRKAMEQQRLWYPIEEYVDKRKKFTRIISGINGPAAAGRVYIKDTHVDFLEQYSQYPEVPHDDILDASSIALMELEGLYVAEDGNIQSVSDLGFKPLPHLDVCSAP